MNDQSHAQAPLEPLAADVAEWLADATLADTPIVTFFDAFCNRLVGIGVPLQRAHLSFSTLHPLFEASACTWTRGEGCVTTDFEHGMGAVEEPWQESPLKHMIEQRIPVMRRRLAGTDAVFDFPVLEDFRDEGITDWIGYVVAFGSDERSGMVGSWCTTRPGGFSDQHVAHLRFLQRPLAVAVKMAVRAQLADNVVHTYLGPVAGRRVLEGQIRRGDGETLPAVIWYSDMRGSTEMAESLGRDGYTAVLNAYFEAMGGAITAAGGEILDFIGDAVLAIFPIDQGNEHALCGRALAAAEAADRSLAEHNQSRAARGEPPLAFGLALHIGEVMFGNIGTQDRLVFSVIGSSVNEVARLQDMTKKLNRHVVVSEKFAAAWPHDWEDLGEHTLAGVGKPMRIFGAPELVGV